MSTTTLNDERPSTQRDDINSIYLASRRLVADSLHKGPAADVLGPSAYTNAQMLSHAIQNLALYQFRMVDAITAELERTQRTLRQTARRCEDLEAQLAEQKAGQ
jgi:hypothetical protein